MGGYVDRPRERAACQHFDGLLIAADESNRAQYVWCNGLTLRHAPEVAEVDDLVFDAKWIVETSAIRQLLDEGKLAALEARWDAPARPRLLPFDTLARGLAAP